MSTDSTPSQQHADSDRSPCRHILTPTRFLEFESFRIRAAGDLGNKQGHVDPIRTFVGMVKLCCSHTDGRHKVDRSKEWRDSYAAELLGDCLQSIADHSESVERMRAFNTDAQVDGGVATLPKPVSPILPEIERLFPDLQQFWSEGKYSILDSNVEGYSPYSIESASTSLAAFLGITPEQIHRYAGRDSLSRLSWRRIFYGLVLRALLTCQMREYFSPRKAADPIQGWSRTGRYFDGMMLLEYELHSPIILLVRVSTLGLTGSSMINDFGVSLQDIDGFVDTPPRGLLFVPDDPSAETRRTVTYWRDVRHVDISVIYMAEFFELFRLWDGKLIKEFIAEEVLW